jgi:transcriptional regulator GlxA family with amidase domain
MDPRVRSVIVLMKNNLQRRLPLREMAESVHLSASHLSQLFKHDTSTSPARYLKELRMERGRELLETTFLGVEEVATRVGSGVSHFVRDFERAYGITPARYAARYRTADRPPPHANRKIG